MKRGVLRVTYQHLAAALGLPEGCEVVSVAPQSAEDMTFQSVSLVLGGAGMPLVSEGTALPWVDLEAVRADAVEEALA